MLAFALTLVLAAYPTSEDLRHQRGATHPVPSPNGRQILYQVTESTADGAAPHLWINDVPSSPTSPPRQLTRSLSADKSGEDAGQWMPDGRSILFLAHRDGHARLFRLPMDGGEPRAYTLKIHPHTAPKSPAVVVDIHAFAVSPDGSTFAVLAADAEAPDEKERKADKDDAVDVDHDPHGTRLYLIDAESEKVTPTAVPADVTRLAWSPDSKRLFAITAGTNGAEDLGFAHSAWIVIPAAPNHPTQLKQLPASIATAAWSQDGAALYFLAHAQADTPTEDCDLYRYGFADDSVTDLSVGFAGSLVHGDPIPDGASAIVLANLGTRVVPVRFGAPAGDKDRGFAVQGPPRPIELGPPVIHELAVNAAHSRWVWRASGSSQPSQILSGTQLTAPGVAVATGIAPPPWTPALSRRVTWRSDGQSVEGLLYLPQRPPTARLPLIVDVHGGPSGVWTDSYDPFTACLLGQGWAVFKPNPRGSSGYGAAFVAANRNDLGGGDYRDIMSGVDAVLSGYPIDPDRLALVGYSYGGEMAGFVEGRTTRFKAIVSGAPVIDQYSEYGTEDESWYDRWYFGQPWRRPADAWRQSPLSGVATAHTPFLLIQGEADETDPLGQSQEMYHALRQEGVPVELIQYPRENHGPLAAGLFGAQSREPWHGLDARRRMIDFISRWFAAAPPPASTRP